MKVILQDNRRHFLRFDKDEEVIEGLVNYAKEHGITAAFFTGIGTSSTVEVGFFNSFLKDYRKKPLLENFEILSLTGNIASLNGAPAVHAHGTFGNNEYGVVGGHVFKVVTLATCEVFLVNLEGKLERGMNEEWKLNLLT
jgi:predicted DNA-binding protein with PD1-like motif